MTIGISKKRLDELKNSINDRFEDGSPTQNIYGLVLDRLISECTELNHWLPIDGNTPKDSKVLLAFPMQDGGYEYAVDFAFESATVRDWNGRGMPAIKPTHYQKIQAPIK